MAKVLFKRRTTAEIEDLEVEDGALIYNTDNGKTYMDFEEERIQTGGNADTMIAIGGEEPTDEDIKIWIKDKDNQNYNNFYYRKNDNKFEQMFLPPTGDTLPIGSIAQFGGEIAPTNWLFCNGQAVSRETYAELFSVIGTTYGDGDGSTTFNVPDFIGRVPVGLDVEDTDFDTLGETGGSKELQEHSHKLKYYINNNLTGGADHFLAYGSNTATVLNAMGTDNAGTGDSGNLQPYTVTNFIIKAKQSIGIVGTVSEDINDTNNNAVPTCETVKDYVDEKSKEVYSTDEVVIGTWIDNKPIYRKCFRMNLTSSNNNTDTTIPNSLISNLSEVTFVRGILKNQYGNFFPLANINPNGNLNEAAGVYYNGAEGMRLRLGNMSVASNSYGTFILEYTKTTD